MIRLDPTSRGYRILWWAGPVAGHQWTDRGHGRSVGTPPTNTGGTTMPNTGDKATATGKYASDCGPQWTITIHAVGNEFPPCPHCHKPVHYTKV
jgi:hypothetical protein